MAEITGDTDILTLLANSEKSMLSTMHLMLQQLKRAVETRVLRQSHAERLITELEKGQWSKITSTTFTQGNPQTGNMQKYLFQGGDSTLVLGGKTTTANSRLGEWIPSAVREYCELTYPCIHSGATLIGVLRALRQNIQHQVLQGKTVKIRLSLSYLGQEMTASATAGSFHGLHLS